MPCLISNWARARATTEMLITLRLAHIAGEAPLHQTMDTDCPSQRQVSTRWKNSQHPVPFSSVSVLRPPLLHIQHHGAMNGLIERDADRTKDRDRNERGGGRDRGGDAGGYRRDDKGQKDRGRRDAHGRRTDCYWDTAQKDLAPAVRRDGGPRGVVERALQASKRRPSGRLKHLKRRRSSAPCISSWQKTCYRPGTGLVFHVSSASCAHGITYC